jgi:hypothetical protein
MSKHKINDKSSVIEFRRNSTYARCAILGDEAANRRKWIDTLRGDIRVLAQKRSLARKTAMSCDKTTNGGGVSHV